MSLCRVNRVARARKSPGTCEHCRTVIEVGQPYRWWKGRYTSKHVRCGKPACSPQPWELETNETKALAMRGEDVHYNAANETCDAEQAASYLREAIEIAQALVDDLNERIDNKAGTALEASSEYQALEESRDGFEYYVSEAESVADDLDALGAAPDESDYDPASPDFASEADPDQAAQDAYDQARLAHCDEVDEMLGCLPDWPELDLGSYGPPRPRRKQKVS
jgi:hypothetical protein